MDVAESVVHSMRGQHCFVLISAFYGTFHSRVTSRAPPRKRNAEQNKTKKDVCDVGLVVLHSYCGKNIFIPDIMRRVHVGFGLGVAMLRVSVCGKLPQPAS